MPGLPLPLAHQRRRRGLPPTVPSRADTVSGSDATIYPVEFTFAARVRLRRRKPRRPLFPRRPRSRPEPELVPLEVAFAATVELRRAREFTIPAQRLPATRIVQARRDDEELLLLI